MGNSFIYLYIYIIYLFTYLYWFREWVWIGNSRWVRFSVSLFSPLVRVCAWASPPFPFPSGISFGCFPVLGKHSPIGLRWPHALTRARTFPPSLRVRFYPPLFPFWAALGTHVGFPTGRGDSYRVSRAFSPCPRLPLWAPFPRPSDPRSSLFLGGPCAGVRGDLLSPFLTRLPETGLFWADYSFYLL